MLVKFLGKLCHLPGGVVQARSLSCAPIKRVRGDPLNGVAQQLLLSRLSRLARQQRDASGVARLTNRQKGG